MIPKDKQAVKPRYNCHPCHNPKCERMAGETPYCVACSWMLDSAGVIHGEDAERFEKQMEETRKNPGKDVLYFTVSKDIARKIKEIKKDKGE